MAELQTVEAALGCAQAAYQICIFLNRVRNADQTAADAATKVRQAGQVLENVGAALKWREQDGSALSWGCSTQVATQIGGSVQACRVIFDRILSRLGGLTNLEDRAPLAILSGRFKVAFHHNTLGRLQSDLDAHINILQASLVVLQLYDGPTTQQAISTSHDAIVTLLKQLESKIDRGNIIRQTLALEAHVATDMRQAEDLDAVEDVSYEDCDKNAITSLEKWLETATDLKDRFTSEYVPDNRSELYRIEVSTTPRDMSPRSGTPEPGMKQAVDIPLRRSSITGSAHERSSPAASDDDDDEEAMPERILTMHINSCREQARQHLDAGHFHQAETNMRYAIDYSKKRSQYYGIHFDDKTELYEDLAIIFQRREKWSEAVSMLHQLLRERKISSDMPHHIMVQKKCRQARQYQLLAVVHHDKYSKNHGDAQDIEQAEKYAYKCFSLRDRLVQDGQLLPEETDRQSECMRLLVRILEARDKTAQANVFRGLLATAEGSSDSGSIRHRASTVVSSLQDTESDFVEVENKQELLLKTIDTGSADELSDFLSLRDDLDIEQLDQKDMTPLMHAVARGEQNIVYSLFSVGADANTANKQKLTALHMAAAAGNDEMIVCLLNHDAAMEAQDKQGDTPLAKAVRNDHLKAARTLIEKGADPKTSNNHEFSLLHLAVRLSKVNMLKYLLDEEPSLRLATDQKGQTALHHCAERELLVQTKALLEHKNQVEVNAQDRTSRRPLFLVASHIWSEKRAEIVDLLLEYGATLSEDNLPPKVTDYPALKRFVRPPPARRRSSMLSRTDTVSTSGSVGTTSTGFTKLKRVFTGSTNRS